MKHARDIFSGPGAKNAERAEVARLGSAESGVESALMHAIADARQTAERENKTTAAIEAVQQASQSLRAAEQRCSDLKDRLEDVTERSRAEAEAALVRLREAEAETAAERARAASAEQRLRNAEERLGQIMQVIAEELAGTRTAARE
jgi:chromosome segregation ATPase